MDSEETLLEWIILQRSKDLRLSTFDSIIETDETAAWHEIISNNAVTDKGTKSVVLETSGHEKTKVTVTLAAKTNDDKLKPYNRLSRTSMQNSKLEKRFCNEKSLLRRINHKWLD